MLLFLVDLKLRPDHVVEFKTIFKIFQYRFYGMLTHLLGF